MHCSLSGSRHRCSSCVVLITETNFLQGNKNTRALDIDSILCLGDKTVLGKVLLCFIWCTDSILHKIEEVFGPVSQPHYSVRIAQDRDAKFVPVCSFML